MDGWTEQIWKEALLIMEQDYTTSDPVSSEDLASGRIIPNPNDDGEHPFTDAPQKENNAGRAIHVPIRSIDLAVVDHNGNQRPWGSVPMLRNMFPFFNKSGYHEWIDCDMLILINDVYLVVYHIHSSYDNINIIKDNRQDEFHGKIADAVIDYLFSKDHGKLRMGNIAHLHIKKEAFPEEGPDTATLMNPKEFKHEFSPLKWTTGIRNNF